MKTKKLTNESKALMPGHARNHWKVKPLNERTGEATVTENMQMLQREFKSLQKIAKELEKHSGELVDTLGQGHSYDVWDPIEGIARDIAYTSRKVLKIAKAVNAYRDKNKGAWD